MPDDLTIYEGLLSDTRLSVRVYPEEIAFRVVGPRNALTVFLSHDTVDRLISDLVRRTPGQAKELKPEEF